MGPDEKEKGIVKLKNMQTGEQKELKQDEISSNI
jgi:histidyl-tRNA synthetase